MSTGQCKVNPVTGIAGDIYNAWTGDGDAGLTASATSSGSTVRKLLGAQVEAIAASINAVAPGDHSLGTTVSWAAGTGAGQYSFGAAAPNATIVSIAGCDEGGTISLTTNANTSSGAIFVIHFGVAFPHAPAGLVFAADAGTGAAMYGFQTWVTTTTTTFTLNIASPLSNAVFTWHWIAKGRT
jgi:hypothetical protein